MSAVPSDTPSTKNSDAPRAASTPHPRTKKTFAPSLDMEVIARRFMGFDNKHCRVKVFREAILNYLRYFCPMPPPNVVRLYTVVTWFGLAHFMRVFVQETIVAPQGAPAGNGKHAEAGRRKVARAEAALSAPGPSTPCPGTPLASSESSESVVCNGAIIVRLVTPQRIVRHNCKVILRTIYHKKSLRLPEQHCFPRRKVQNILKRYLVTYHFHKSVPNFVTEAGCEQVCAFLHDCFACISPKKLCDAISANPVQFRSTNTFCELFCALGDREAKFYEIFASAISTAEKIYSDVCSVTGASRRRRATKRVRDAQGDAQSSETQDSESTCGRAETCKRRACEQAPSSPLRGAVPRESVCTSTDTSEHTDADGVQRPEASIS